MNKCKIICLLLLLPLLYGGEAYSQSFLRKVKEKAEDKAIKKIFGEDQQNNNNNNNSSGTSTSGNSNSGSMGTYGTTGSGSSGSVQNTKGGGLVTTPPDVKENIASAKSAYAAKNYADAKYSVRQAILGIEMELGKKVLTELPEKADGLPTVPEEDKVTSGSAGLVGLTIQRIYRSNDKELKLMIANDAMMLSAVNMYLQNGGYTTSSDEKNTKQTKFKGYRAIIQYDDNSGYTLSVPFGQSSLFTVNGVNYASESEFMNAANLFDLDKIKTTLGEK